MQTKKLQLVTSLIQQAANADTLDGKHAEEFALASDVEKLNTQVGDKSVSEQINTAIASKADADHTHEISELVDLSSASVSHATTADTASAVAWTNVTGKPNTYAPSTHSHAISDVTNLQSSLDAKVPTSRTVNGKALSANITLSASDVGADVSGAANTALANAKLYTDAEIGEWIGDKTVADQITTAIAEKAPTSHASTATTYGASSASNYGHAMASSTTPKANGTAAVGSETAKFARGDHVHPLQTTVSGNAGTATALQTTRYIDGVSFTGAANVTRYATCSTAAGTAAKTASITAGTFSLITGARVTVKFSNANSVASPTLNVGSTGAKAIYWHGAALASGQYWQAGAVLDFVYNGTQWELVGIAKDNNTTYSVATTSANGLMSKADKSTLDSLSTLVGDTAVATQISNAIATKADVSHTHSNYALANQSCSNKDFNSITTTGFYYGYTGMTNAASQSISVLEVINYSADWIVQRQTVITATPITYERTRYSGTTWSEWHQLMSAQNFSLSGTTLTITTA